MLGSSQSEVKGFLCDSIEDMEDFDGFTLHAPSLAGLPPRSPLLMATLPIVDWNACLIRALETSGGVLSGKAFVALLAADQYLCREDLSDLVAMKGLAGIANFPPASLCGAPATWGAHCNAAEIDFLEWLGGQGHRILYVAASIDEAGEALERLRAYTDAVLHVPAATLDMQLARRMPLDVLRRHEDDRIPAELPLLTFAAR